MSSRYEQWRRARRDNIIGIALAVLALVVSLWGCSEPCKKWHDGPSQLTPIFLGETWMYIWMPTKVCDDE